MVSDDVIEQGTVGGAEHPPEGTPEPSRQKGSGGAPKGNKNASQANLYSGDPGLRRKGLKLAGKLFRTWLKELPKEHQENRQLRTALREMADLTVLRNRAFDYCLMRSPVDSKSGELRPVFQQLVELSDRIHKWRLEVMQVCGADEAATGDARYVMSFADGRGAAPGGRVPGAALTKEVLPLPSDEKPKAEPLLHRRSAVLRQPEAPAQSDKPKQPASGDPLGLGWMRWQ